MDPLDQQGSRNDRQTCNGIDGTVLKLTGAGMNGPSKFAGAVLRYVLVAEPY